MEGIIACSGQSAALAGGTTFHMDMLMPEKGGDILAGYARHKQAAERSVMDYSFHIVITHWNDEASVLTPIIPASAACQSLTADIKW